MGRGGRNKKSGKNKADKLRSSSSGYTAPPIHFGIKEAMEKTGKLPEGPLCPECGAPWKEGAADCWNCGF